MKKIKVKPIGPDDWQAEVEGQPVMSGRGNTADAAIGDLVKKHKKFFGIQIEY